MSHTHTAQPEQNLTFADKLEHWHDAAREDFPENVQKFVKIGATYSCLFALADDGQLYAWNWKDDLPTNKPQAVNKRLGIDPSAEIITDFECCAWRVAIVTNKRRIGLVVDGCQQALVESFFSPLMDLPNGALPEKLMVCPLYTAVQTTANRRWGAYPFTDRSQLLESSKKKGRDDNGKSKDIAVGAEVCTRSVPMYASGSVGVNFSAMGVPLIGILMESAWTLSETCRLRVYEPSEYATYLQQNPHLMSKCEGSLTDLNVRKRAAPSDEGLTPANPNSAPAARYKEDAWNLGNVTFFHKAPVCDTAVVKIVDGNIAGFSLSSNPVLPHVASKSSSSGPTGHGIGSDPAAQSGSAFPPPSTGFGAPLAINASTTSASTRSAKIRRMMIAARRPGGISGRAGVIVDRGRSVLPASSIPEELIAQAQVMLQRKFREIIVRELQRTNLNVNEAVNNLLSRDDDEVDELDDASESYLHEELLSLLDAGLRSDPSGAAVIDGEGMYNATDGYEFLVNRDSRRRDESKSKDRKADTTAPDATVATEDTNNEENADTEPRYGFRLASSAIGIPGRGGAAPVAGANYSPHSPSIAWAIHRRRNANNADPANAESNNSGGRDSNGNAPASSSNGNAAAAAASQPTTSKSVRKTHRRAPENEVSQTNLQLAAAYSLLVKLIDELTLRLAQHDLYSQNLQGPIRSLLTFNSNHSIALAFRSSEAADSMPHIDPGPIRHVSLAAGTYLFHLNIGELIDQKLGSFQSTPAASAASSPQRQLHDSASDAALCHIELSRFYRRSNSISYPFMSATHAHNAFEYAVSESLPLVLKSSLLTPEAEKAELFMLPVPERTVDEHLQMARDHGLRNPAHHSLAASPIVDDIVYHCDVKTEPVDEDDALDEAMHVDHTPVLNAEDTKPIEGEEADVAPSPRESNADPAGQSNEGDEAIHLEIQPSLPTNIKVAESVPRRSSLRTIPGTSCRFRISMSLFVPAILLMIEGFCWSIYASPFLTTKDPTPDVVFLFWLSSLFFFPLLIWTLFLLFLFLFLKPPASADADLDATSDVAAGRFWFATTVTYLVVLLFVVNFWKRDSSSGPLIESSSSSSEYHTDLLLICGICRRLDL